MGKSNKSLSLAVSVVAHVALFLLIKPKGLESIAINAALNFNSGQLIINSIMKDEPKTVATTALKRPILKKNVEKAKTQDVIQIPVEKSAPTVTASNTPEVKTFEKSILTPNITPHYPRVALKRGWQGFVRIQMLVSAEGKVTGIKVLEQNAHQTLVDSALTAARQWLFRASPDGRTYLVEKRVIFKIN